MHLGLFCFNNDSKLNGIQEWTVVSVRVEDFTKALHTDKNTFLLTKRVCKEKALPVSLVPETHMVLV